MSAAPKRRASRSILLTALVASGFAVLSFAPAASAQENQGGQGQGQGQGDRGGRGGGEQFRQRMQERMKEMLGASDEEWNVLSPKIEKVMTAQRQASRGGGGMGMLFAGGRGGPGGGRGDGEGRRGGDGEGRRGGDGEGRRGPGGGAFGGGGEDSPVAQKSRDLRQAIENNASPDEVKTKLAALREARTKAREQLTAAQTELKELLTPKQEAALVVMGVLE